MLSCSVVSNSLWPHGLQPTKLLGPWNSPGKNTGVGCNSLLQGIFPTQGSNPRLLCLLYWEVGSLWLHHSGSPRHQISEGYKTGLKFLLKPSRKNPVPPPRVQRSLCVPCLSLVEKLKYPRPPRVTKEQAQAVNDQDNRVTASFSVWCPFPSCFKDLPPEEMN